MKGKSWTKIITVNGSVYEHCVENIKEKDELVFRISAENAVGVSLPAESQSVRLEKHASKFQTLIAIYLYRRTNNTVSFCFKRIILNNTFQI